jgi:phosphoenolpyruvate carboxykinase (ATP)
MLAASSRVLLRSTAASVGSKTVLKALASRNSSTLSSPLAGHSVAPRQHQQHQQVAVAFKSTSAAVQAAAASSLEGRNAYKVAATLEGTDACLKAGIDTLGITGPSTVYKNLTYPELFEHEIVNKEGVVAKAEYGDTFTVDTGMICFNSISHGL